MKSSASRNKAIILLSCPDQQGLVASISQFLYKNKGNIIQADQHTDMESHMFYFRVEWEISGFKLSKSQTRTQFEKLAKKYQMKWQIFYPKDPTNIAIFVSKETHCLHDLLSRHDEGDLACNIPLIVSNHLEARSVAKKFGIHFEYFTDPKKLKSEEKIFKLLKHYHINTIVLARYMQILSARYIERYPNQIINIHHSFLPAFIGASPYAQAYERGVKIIGATSHYVTEKLDQGPIIEQDVIRINHRDTTQDLKRKGKDLEKIVLARALRFHLERRTLLHQNKTLIFE